MTQLRPFFYVSIEVDKHVVKKNSRDIFMNRKTGRMFPSKSPDLKQAETLLINAMTIAKQRLGVDRYSGPIWAVFNFRFPRKEYYCQTKGTKGEPIGRRNSKIPDLSNLYELPQDCLEKAGVILNDSLIEAHDGSRRTVGDSFRLEIRLFSMP